MLKECLPILYKLKIFGNKLDSSSSQGQSQAQVQGQGQAQAQAQQHTTNDVEIEFNNSNDIAESKNNSNIIDKIELQDSLIGNRKWIRKYKSENDNYKYINRDIVRQYSSMSAIQLSSNIDSDSDVFDTSSKDIFRVSIDNVSGPIIQRIKNTNTNTST